MSVPAIGPGSLLQGTIPADRRLRSRFGLRRLEAVVLSPDGVSLIHYHRDQTRPDRPWVRGETITTGATAPGAIAQDAGTLTRPGDLHVLVPEAGGAVGHYVRSSASGESRRWRPARGDERFPAVRTLTGHGPSVPDAVAVALAESALCALPGVGDALAALPGGGFGVALPAVHPGGHGWVQALVQVGDSIHQWHRQEWRGRVRWMRAACLRFAPTDGFTVDAASSVKVAQVTGERDSQPSRSSVTLSSSASRSGVRGTDLGVRVDHAGRTLLLFGDSHWRGRPDRVTLDALGEVSAQGPLPGLPGVELHGAPIKLVGGAATSREYDVPLDGFSAGGDLFAFFSSHHFARHQVMGRSLLTRAVEPALPVAGRERRRRPTFHVLGAFSDLHFVNVSVQRRGRLLYVWGSGSYRADDLRLAVLDLGVPALRAALSGRAPWTRPLEGVRYWAGSGDDGAPRWSSDEVDAAPVLHGAFGEISVRWVPALDAYVLLAMDGPEDPIGRGVTMRTSPEPWGPWTPRRRLFDWETNGMSAHDEASRFIRAHHEGDPVGDAVFRLQASMTGAAYAPYLFDARADGDDVVLRYTLSTWNPYQVVLMEHRLAGARQR